MTKRKNFERKDFWKAIVAIAVTAAFLVNGSAVFANELAGEEPQLTAIADSGWTFDSWSGDLNGNTNQTTIFMDGNKDVTAIFTEEGDTIPPVTICILNPPEPDGDNGWYVSVVTVTLVATDEGSGVESTWYRLDGGYWKIYINNPFVVSQYGYHTVEYYSFDRAGNRETIKIVEFKIDTKLPTTTHKFDGIIGEDGWFISNVTITLIAGDIGSGLNDIKYKLDDGTWMNYTEMFDVTEDGEYTLYYYSVDLAGNTETTKEVDFKIEKDLIPPVTIHEFEGDVGENGWYVNDVTVTLIATDNADDVNYTMYKLHDDTEWQNYIGSILVNEDGNHTIEYYSVDKVGNKEDNKGPFPFKIDQTVPTIELTWDEENSRLVADVYDETGGVAKVEFYVNDEYVGESTILPYEWEVTNPKKGDVGQAIVFDNAGNEALSEKITPQSNSQNHRAAFFNSSTTTDTLLITWPMVKQK